jgi:hypothetical protein
MPNQATPSTSAPDAAALRTMLKSQYHAVLAMLKSAIEKCPEEIWFGDGPRAACWQQAYHALFFAQLYSRRQNPDSFRPWPGHRAEVQYEDGIAGPPEPESELPLLAKPYTKAEALEFWAHCDGGIDAAVDAMDLASPESGFSWYAVPKLEHQIVNIRHIEHHMAKIADRVRAAADVGIDWVGARRPR